MLRCVVREDLSMEMANDLVSDVTQCVEWLDHHFIFSEVMAGCLLKSSGCTRHQPGYEALTAVYQPAISDYLWRCACQGQCSAVAPGTGHSVVPIQGSSCTLSLSGAAVSLLSILQPLICLCRTR